MACHVGGFSEAGPQSQSRCPLGIEQDVSPNPSEEILAAHDPGDPHSPPTMSHVNCQDSLAWDPFVVEIPLALLS